MLIRALVLSLSLSSFGAIPVLADQHKSEAPIKKRQSPATGTLSPSQKTKTVELAKDLDGLFAQLKRTRDTKVADRISTRIWEFWQTSDSRSIDILSLWARNATGQRDFGRAMDLMDQVVVMRPDYAEGYNQRATLHFFMRNFDKSIADIERVLALEPRHYGALSGLAGILEQIGQKEQALKTWYRALAVYPAMKRGQEAVVRLEEVLAGSGI